MTRDDAARIVRRAIKREAMLVCPKCDEHQCLSCYLATEALEDLVKEA